MAFDEDSVRETLKNLQIQVNCRETFIDSVSQIKALLIHYYQSSSPSLQKLFYTAVCDVESTLQIRFTEFEFWIAGKELFEEAERQVANSSEREYLQSCITRACEHLDNVVNHPETILSVEFPTDPPTPRSTLQVAHELLATLGVVADSSQGLRDENNTLERASELMEEMVTTMQEFRGFQNLFDSIEAAIQGTGGPRPMRQPPASKEVIEKLPVVTISKEMIESLGIDMECAVCRENVYVNEKMHELPCKHMFHLHCLIPWMDIHNSCPVCRHELPTDDDAYESWKEREKEARKNDTALRIH
ncbi:RING-type E3 ubiquitin transferase [Ranunculus cassubicifolius]